MALQTRGITRYEPRAKSVPVVVGIVAVAVGLSVLFALVDSGANAVFGAVVAALPVVLLGGLLLPGLVMIARRPQRGVLTLIALVPFYGVVRVLPWKPPYAEGWKEALALYTLCWALASTPKRTRTRWRFPTVVQPIVVYLAIGSIWLIVLHNVRGIVGYKVNFFWLLLAITIWRTPLDERDRDRVVSILMVDAVLTSIVALWQQYVGAEYLVNLGYDYNTNVRFTGSFLRSFSTMDNPFNFAFFLAFVLLIVLPQCLEEPKRLRNQTFFALTPLVGIALIATFVRGAWLALAVGCMYLAVRRYRVFLLLAPFALIALLVVPGNFSESAFGTSSLGDRQEGWAQNINKAMSAPFGTGIGATGAAGLKAQAVLGVENPEAVVFEPDNQYYKALYELGVFGVWALGLMFVGIVLSSRRAELELRGLDRAWALGLTAHMLGAIAAATISTWLEIFPNDLFLWMTLAIVMSMTKVPVPPDAPRSTPRRFALAAAASRPMSANSSLQ